MVSAILLLGGSASISALTGMDIRAAAMLLPVGVIGNYLPSSKFLRISFILITYQLSSSLAAYAQLLSATTAIRLSFSS